MELKVLKRSISIVGCFALFFSLSSAPTTATESLSLACDSDAIPELCINDQLNGYFDFYPTQGEDENPNYISAWVVPRHEPAFDMPGFSPNSKATIRGEILGDPEFYWEYRVFSGAGIEKPEFKTKGSFRPSHAASSCQDGPHPEFLKICDVPDSGQPPIHLPRSNEYIEIFVHNVPIPGSPVIVYDRFSESSEPVYENVAHYATGDIVSFTRTAVLPNSEWVVNIDNEKISLNGSRHTYSDDSLGCQTTDTNMDVYYSPAYHPEVLDTWIKSKMWQEEFTGSVSLQELGISKSGTYFFVIDQYLECPSISVNRTFQSLKSGDNNSYVVQITSLEPQRSNVRYVTSNTSVNIPSTATQQPAPETQLVSVTTGTPSATTLIQTPTTALPATIKAKKSIKVNAKSSAGLPIKVKVKGSCTVKSNTKTTVKKVGKKKVKTKTVVSYSVKLGKKGKSCTVTQTSPSSGSVSAMNSVSVVKIR
jgi:hypothetical protein